MPYTEAELEQLITTLTTHLRYKLLRNTHKQHWSTKDDAYHRRRLLEELDEQDLAIEHETAEAVWHEAADIAAFAAFRAVRFEWERKEEKAATLVRLQREELPIIPEKFNIHREADGTYSVTFFSFLTLEQTRALIAAVQNILEQA